MGLREAFEQRVAARRGSGIHSYGGSDGVEVRAAAHKVKREGVFAKIASVHVVSGEDIRMAGKFSGHVLPLSSLPIPANLALAKRYAATLRSKYIDIFTSIDRALPGRYYMGSYKGTTGGTGYGETLLALDATQVYPRIFTLFELRFPADTPPPSLRSNIAQHVQVFISGDDLGENTIEIEQVRDRIAIVPYFALNRMLDYCGYLQIARFRAVLYRVLIRESDPFHVLKNFSIASGDSGLPVALPIILEADSADGLVGLARNLSFDHPLAFQAGRHLSIESPGELTALLLLESPEKSPEKREELADRLEAEIQGSELIEELKSQANFLKYHTESKGYAAALLIGPVNATALRCGTWEHSLRKIKR
jgi:hypothetical protein